jgi:hypothetical protein
MKLQDLDDATIERIRRYRYDRILEKHEGPWRWDGILRHYEPEFMTIEGYDVLLPIGQDQHPNIEIVRCIVDREERYLTIFLKDRTWHPDPKDELFYVGRLAICERFPGHSFYLGVVYHEWYVIDNSGE